MHSKGPVSVLLAPLDWGLGHATRCIPIVNQLILQGTRVMIATSGAQRALLEQEFPQLEFLDIPGYAINYKPGFLLKWGLFFRIPSILKQIKRENRWLEEIRKEHEIDAVISDNRYGLYNKNVFCVFITHQLFIQSGLGGSRRLTAGFLQTLKNNVNSWIDRRILKWNYSFIRKFSECWVPDQEGVFSVAGRLSHPPVSPPIPVKYIGLLSRFERVEKPVVKNTLLILLSGPEPQRTRLENIIFRQLAGTGMQTLVLRGLPGEGPPIPFIGNNIKIFNHLPGRELNSIILESEYIIARCGYSTMMDLLQLKKNAIVVPTPGQPEQEYLGQYLHEKKWMFMVRQKNFNLLQVLSVFQGSALELPEFSEYSLQHAVEEFLREAAG